LVVTEEYLGHARLLDLETFLDCFQICLQGVV
jgi:hypothetical protein